MESKPCTAVADHRITMENRKSVTMTDVKEIESFDEGEIKASLSSGAVIIKGERLTIKMLDLQDGTCEIAGLVTSLMYVKGKGKKGKCALWNFRTS